MDFIHQVEPWITPADRDAVNEYMSSGGWLTEHVKTAQFERAVADYLGVKYAVAVPNGTIGLYIALQAMNISFEHVVLPSYTMMATINAVLWSSCFPILIDIDPNTGCLDDRYLNEETFRAIGNGKNASLMYVAINGRSGDMHALKELCNKTGVKFIEDACQAFGSKCGDKYLGTFGDIGVFSLSPHKIITTGQGGLLVTDNVKYYERMKSFKDFGRSQIGKDWHIDFGLNFKFTDLQASLGLSQLGTIEERKAKKLEIFETYQKNLPENVVLLPLAKGNVPWFVDALFPSTSIRESESIRERLKVWLKLKRGIGTRPFYPPLFNQPSLQNAFKRVERPYTEEFSAMGLWLPSSLTLTQEKIEYVCNSIKDFFKEDPYVD